MKAMKKPAAVKSTDEVTTIGKVFGTPLVVKGKTWLPLAELLVWPVMAWLAGRERCDRGWWQRMGIGALMTAVVLGSEWCHNLAHAAAALLVGKPMDALRIVWGMPLVVYFDIGDETVTPREHILRAIGGPVCNALLLPLALIFRRFTRENSGLSDVANAALGMNVFLSTVSLLPIPGIDGGPILKWSLVERGYTPEAADEKVRGVNQVMSGGLGFAAWIAFRKRRWFLGSILALLAALALALGFGLVEE
jgi:Zn-dependent protease